MTSRESVESTNSPQLLWGDFSSIVPINGSYSDANYAWLSHAFLGYPSGQQTAIRAVFYPLADFLQYTGSNVTLVVFLFATLCYFSFLNFKELGLERGVAWLFSFSLATSIVVLDRMAHTLIIVGLCGLFAAVYFGRKYLLSEKISLPLLLGFCISVLFLCVSMHVVYMTLLLSPALLVPIFRDDLKGSSVNRSLFIQKVGLSILALALTSAHIWLLYGYLALTGTQSVIDQVGDLSSAAIYYYSEKSKFPDTFAGAGYFYSQVSDHSLIIAAVVVYVPTILVFALLQLKNGALRHAAMTAYLIAIFLATITMSKPFIPTLKNYLPAFASVKDTSYFLLPATVFSLFALGSFLVNFKSAFRFRVSFLLAALNGTIAAYALATFDVFRTSTPPASYFHAAKLVPDGERVLVLPTGWVSQFDWSNGKILSGFFHFFFLRADSIGSSILEGPSADSRAKLNEIITCVESGCDDIATYIEETGTRYVAEFKNAQVPFSSGTPLNYKAFFQTLRESCETRTLLEDNDVRLIEISCAERSKFSKVSVDNAKVTKVNPTYYKVLINKPLDKSVEIVFRDSFSKHWNLYSESTLPRILQKPLNVTHSKYAQFGNAWSIEQRTLDDLGATRSTEESVAEITLFYTPQAYYELGTKISQGAFLAFLVGILVSTISRLRILIVRK